MLPKSTGLILGQQLKYHDHPDESLDGIDELKAEKAQKAEGTKVQQAAQSETNGTEKVVAVIMPRVVPARRTRAAGKGEGSFQQLCL